MAILNLTQHTSTPEQQAEGVVDLVGHEKETLHRLLTFDVLPTPAGMTYRAERIAALAQHYNFALIGGAPYFMPPLESALREVGVSPLYAFSRREVAETKDENGVVKKFSTFRHIGFVDPDDAWND